MVERFVLDGQQARLTQAALETLAVVAYQQPVSRGPGLGDPRRQRRRRDAHAADPRPGRGGRPRTTRPGRTSTAPRRYFLERIGVTSLDDLPELAPFLPDVDDLDDDERSQAPTEQRRRPSPTTPGR